MEVDWAHVQAELLEIFWQCDTAAEVRAAAAAGQLGPEATQWLERSADKPLEVACKLVKRWGHRRE